MNPHQQHPRQQWDTPMGGVASPMGAYAIHARFLGVNPTVPHDLIASMLFCIVFAALIGACVFVGRNPLFRSFHLYTLFAASVLLFLAFAIRAGIANSSSPLRSSFIAECLFLILAQLCIVDAWVVRLRDELLDFLDDNHQVDLRGAAGWKSLRENAKKHAETRWLLITRITLLPLCTILYIVGYFTLPSPENYGAQVERNDATREVASFLVFIILSGMQAISLKHACFNLPPWIPYTILFGIALLLWLPAIYAFSLLAMALDTSSFVRSKTFFYVGFGFAHAVAIGGLIVMHRRKRVWEYQVGQDAAGEEAKEAAEEAA